MLSCAPTLTGAPGVTTAQLGFFLFFGQHTFNPFMEQTHADYNVVKAGIYSSSFFVMDPISNWVSFMISSFLDRSGCLPASLPGGP